MSSILLQIAKIAEYENISIGALERKIGASKGVLSRAIANNTDIQSKWIQSIVANYPHINVDWLITGKGEMLKQTPTEISTTSSPSIINGSNDKYISQLESENKRLIVENERKQELIDRLLNGKLG